MIFSDLNNWVAPQHRGNSRAGNNSGKFENHDAGPDHRNRKNQRAVAAHTSHFLANFSFTKP